MTREVVQSESSRLVGFTFFVLATATPTREPMAWARLQAFAVEDTWWCEGSSDERSFQNRHAARRHVSVESNR